MRKLALFALVLCALPAMAQFPYLPLSQSDGPVVAGGQASNTCTTSQNVTAGQMEIVFTQWYASASPTGASSTLISSGNWHQALNHNSYPSYGGEAIYVGFAGSGGATDTITVSVSGSTYQSTTCAVLPAYYSTTLDATPACTNFSSGTSETTPTLTTSYNNSLLLYLSLGGANASGFAPATAGVAFIGFQNGNDAIASAMQVAGVAGTYSMTWNVYDPSTATVCIAALKLANTGITFTTPASLPDSIVGNAYSYTPLVVGGQGAVTWSKTAGSLPGGLSLNSSSGAITGTVSGSTGVFSFTLQATDGTNTNTQSATIKIGPALNTPTVHCSAHSTVFSTGSLTCNPVTAGDTLIVLGGVGLVTGHTSTFGFYCTDTCGSSFNIARFDYTGNGNRQLLRHQRGVGWDGCLFWIGHNHMRCC